MKKQFILKGIKDNREETIKCVEEKKHDIDVYRNGELDNDLKVELLTKILEYEVRSMGCGWLYQLDGTDTIEAYLFVLHNIYFAEEPEIISMSKGIDTDGIFYDENVEY